MTADANIKRDEVSALVENLAKLQAEISIKKIAANKASEHI